MSEKKNNTKGEESCCHYATMFWEDIDGIVQNIVSYGDEKRELRRNDLETAFEDAGSSQKSTK